MIQNEWNPANQCMSYITDKDRRCQNKSKSDFCAHHHKYNDKILNDIRKEV